MSFNNGYLKGFQTERAAFLQNVKKKSPPSVDEDTFEYSIKTILKYS